MKENSLYQDNKGYFYIKKIYHGKGKNDYSLKKNRIKMNKSILKYLSDNIFINLETKKKKKKKNKPKPKEPTPQEIKIIQNRKHIDDEYMANMQAAGRPFNPNILNVPNNEQDENIDVSNIPIIQDSKGDFFYEPKLKMPRQEAEDRFMRRRENKRFGNSSSSSDWSSSDNSEQSDNKSDTVDLSQSWLKQPSSSSSEEVENLDFKNINLFKKITGIKKPSDLTDIGLNFFFIDLDNGINRLLKYDNIKKFLYKKDGFRRQNFSSNVRSDFFKELKDSGLIAQINDDIKNGRGNNGNGISNIDIEKGMKNIKMKNFYGTFMSDELKYLPTNKKVFSFIINTDNSKKEGKHWIAVNITPTSLEYYDPLSGNMIKGFKENMKKILRRNGITKLKLKINKVRDQRLNSDSCGYFSMKFLIDRNVKNKPFDVASGYKGIDVAERSVGFFRKKFNHYI